MGLLATKLIICLLCCARVLGAREGKIQVWHRTKCCHRYIVSGCMLHIDPQLAGSCKLDICSEMIPDEEKSWNMNIYTASLSTQSEFTPWLSDHKTYTFAVNLNVIQREIGRESNNTNLVEYKHFRIIKIYQVRI